jgi:DNA processing protein
MEDKWPICTWQKEYWPKELINIPDPPKSLRIRGDLPPPENYRLCVVGPRKYTEYGEAVCRKLIEGLRGYPISIVSGLAFGIDSIAHDTALKNKIHVIALPGSGLSDSVVYPKSQLNFAHEILDSGGCLISEYHDSFEATNWSFPRRNRLMVGLSMATLIIEAAEKSGTMITARLTADYNRDMLTVPGSILSLNSVGANSLIKDGAHVIQSAEDIIDFIGFKKIEKSIDDNDLTPEEKVIYSHLNEPTDIETLLIKTGVAINILNATISSLEIKDLIVLVHNKICKK